MRDCTPKISVVVTSYNYAHLIRETLDALAAQTYPNFEVLVIDNASRDDSVEIIREYVRKDPRFKLTVHGRNLGLPASIKHGTELATGEFVAFCEADDIWTVDHLRKIVELLRERWGEPSFIVNDLELFGDPDLCRVLEAQLALRAPALAKTKTGFLRWSSGKETGHALFPASWCARKEHSVRNMAASPE